MRCILRERGKRPCPGNLSRWCFFSQFCLLCLIFFITLLTHCGANSGGGQDTTADIAQTAPQTVNTSPTVHFYSDVSKMAVGDAMWVDFDETGHTNIVIPETPGAEYHLVLQSAQLPTSSTKENYSFTISDTPVPDSTPPTTKQTNQADKSELPAIGDSVEFHPYYGGNTTGRFRLKTRRTALYWDQNVPDNVLTDDELQMLGKQYDAAIDTLEVYFDKLPDINGDGALTILFTKNLSNLFSEGIVTAYFYAADLYTSESRNQQDIIYVIAPKDPKDGPITGSTSHDNVINNLITGGTIAHECTHLINAYSRFISNNGGSEYRWISEGTAHLMEDLTGYNNENISKVQAYLANSAGTPIAFSNDGRDTLAVRGGVYLLLRYLYEQHPQPEDFVRNLIQNKIKGTETVAKAFGSIATDFGNFDDYFKHFGLVIALAGTNSTTDPRYTFRPMITNAETQHLQGICFDRSIEDRPCSDITPNSAQFHKGVGTSHFDIVGMGQQLVSILSFEGPIFIQVPPEAKPRAVLARVR